MQIHITVKRYGSTRLRTISFVTTIFSAIINFCRIEKEKKQTLEQASTRTHCNGMTQLSLGTVLKFNQVQINADVYESIV